MEEHFVVILHIVDGVAFSPVVGLALLLMVEILTCLILSFCLALCNKLLVIEWFHIILYLIKQYFQFLGAKVRINNGEQARIIHIKKGSWMMGEGKQDGPA
jgi:hypothetical protein